VVTTSLLGWGSGSRGHGAAFCCQLSPDCSPCCCLCCSSTRLCSRRF